MAEQLLSIKQSSKRVGVGLTRMRELLALDVVPLVRFNQRLIRIREADLDAWIQAGCPLPMNGSAASGPDSRARKASRPVGRGQHATRTADRA